jgi:hypothetical protein
MYHGMRITDTDEIETTRLRCEHCANESLFRWPRALMRQKPEFVPCSDCDKPVSTRFDSVPHVHHNQGKKIGQRTQDLATPEQPAVTNLADSRPRASVPLRYVVQEGLRTVTDGDLERLLGLVEDYRRAAIDTSISIAQGTPDHERECVKRELWAKDVLYAALGVHAQ